MVLSGGCDEPWQQRERKRLTGPVGFPFIFIYLFIFSIDLFFINSVWLLGKEGKKIMVFQFC